MAKKCVDCQERADYKIKDTSEYYCSECAIENFSDLSLLVVLEDEAMKLKRFIESRVNVSNDDSSSSSSSSSSKEANASGDGASDESN